MEQDAVAAPLVESARAQKQCRRALAKLATTVACAEQQHDGSAPCAQCVATRAELVELRRAYVALERRLAGLSADMEARLSEVLAEASKRDIWNVNFSSQRPLITTPFEAYALDHEALQAQAPWRSTAPVAASAAASQQQQQQAPVHGPPLPNGAATASSSQPRPPRKRATTGTNQQK
jgi:hypothetical protein